MKHHDTKFAALASIPDSTRTFKLFAPCLLMLLLQLPAFADHLHHVWYNNAGWQDEDLTALAGGPVIDSVAGIAAFHTTPNNELHVYYTHNISDFHIHQMYFNNHFWQDDDLTALTGGPSTLGAAISGFAIRNLQYVFYSGNDNHIHELNYNNAGWVDIDITAEAGGPSSDPDFIVAFPTKPNNEFHVYYPVYNPSNQLLDLHQLYFNGTSWVDNDLTAITGGARCQGSIQTSGYAQGNLQQLFCQSLFSDSQDDMLQIDYNNSTWVYQDITALTAGDVEILPGAGQAAFAVAGKKEVFGITNDYHVQQYEQSHGKWKRTDLTNTVGAPENAYPGEMTGFNTTPNNQFHVYYIPNTNPNNVYSDVYQLYYNGSAWSVNKLTNSGEADALGGMAGFAIGNLQHVFYEAQGN
jgi:hypothetical protein